MASNSLTLTGTENIIALLLETALNTREIRINAIRKAIFLLSEMHD